MAAVCTVCTGQNVLNAGGSGLPERHLRESNREMWSTHLQGIYTI